MKKLFFALMAVLVLASCSEKKTVADVMMMTAETMNASTEKINAAETADGIISAMSEMNADLTALSEKYAETMDSVNEENVEELYPAESEALRNAAQELVMAIMEKTQSVEFTPEQEEQLMKILEEGN
ncbi:MAG: lipoprotein [Bacteroidaceae bacterium]|jgi:hypothetical protein|nr:lipoprotein [Bacteroidaceae bacterium]